MVDFLVRRNQDDLGRELVRLEFALDESQQRVEELVVVEIVDVLRCRILEADVSTFDRLIGHVEERTHKNKSVRLVASNSLQEVGKRVVSETIASRERTSRHNNLKGLRVLSVLVVLQEAVVVERLRVRQRLIDAVHVESGVGVVETFARYHFTFEQVELLDFTKVEFQLVNLGRAVLVSVVQKTTLLSSQIALFCC